MLANLGDTGVKNEKVVFPMGSKRLDSLPESSPWRFLGNPVRRCGAENGFEASQWCNQEGDEWASTSKFCICVCDHNIHAVHHIFNPCLQKREIELEKFYKQQEQRAVENARTVATLSRIRTHLPRFTVCHVIHMQDVMCCDDVF